MGALRGGAAARATSLRKANAVQVSGRNHERRHPTVYRFPIRVLHVELRARLGQSSAFDARAKCALDLDGSSAEAPGGRTPRSEVSGSSGAAPGAEVFWSACSPRWGALWPWGLLRASAAAGKSDSAVPRVRGSCLPSARRPQQGRGSNWGGFDGVPFLVWTS